MDPTRLATIATSLETAASASTSANATIPGYCKRIALACESIAGASTAANSGEAGWLLRAAVALEAKEGTSPAGFNRGVEGLWARIMAALEHNAGVSAGSVLKRAQVAAAAYVAVAAYTTAAVHFDGATVLANAALVATDNAFVSMSYWVKLDYAALIAVGKGTIEFIMVNPLVTGSTFSEIANIASPGTPPPKSFDVYFGDSTGANQFVAYSEDPFPDGVWCNIIASVDTNHAAGLKKIKILLNGVDVTDSFGADTAPAFLNGYNGLPFWIGGDAYIEEFALLDCADFWYAPGQSLLDGSGVIPPATIAKFISGGKPVSLGADGSTPTGTAPAIFLRRAPAAAASTFATNLGTGGAFTTTGTLTNALSSPSD